MYVIVDFNYIFYRILFAKTTGVAYPSNILDKQELQRDIIASIHNTIIQYPVVTQVVICADGGTSWRTTVPGNEQYKANRTDRHSKVDMESAMVVFNNILTTLEHCGIPVLKVPTIEGDDWCCCLSYLLYKQGISSLILSGDKDLLQLLKASEAWNKYVVLYNQFDQTHYLPSPIPESAVDIFSLETVGNLGVLGLNSTIVDPTTVSLTKIMSGDKSDNVPSAYSYSTKNGKSTFGFTEKRVLQLLERLEVTPVLQDLVESSPSRISLAKDMIETVSTRDSAEDVDVLHRVEEGLIRNIKSCYLHPSTYPQHVKATILNKIKQVLGGTRITRDSIITTFSKLVAEYSKTDVNYKDL